MHPFISLIQCVIKKILKTTAKLFNCCTRIDRGHSAFDLNSCVYFCFFFLLFFLYSKKSVQVRRSNGLIGSDLDEFFLKRTVATRHKTMDQTVQWIRLYRVQGLAGFFFFQFSKTLFLHMYQYMPSTDKKLGRTVPG
jgi:hypothetical protein